jgi:hypothetical protein
MLELILATFRLGCPVALLLRACWACLTTCQVVPACGMVQMGSPLRTRARAPACCTNPSHKTSALQLPRTQTARPTRSSAGPAAPAASRCIRQSTRRPRAGRRPTAAARPMVGLGAPSGDASAVLAAGQRSGQPGKLSASAVAAGCPGSHARCACLLITLLTAKTPLLF